MEAFKRDKKVSGITRATAMGFGAALASNYCAPELSAAIVTLDFTPGSAPFTTASTLRSIQIRTSGGASAAGFSQWNDSIGKSMQFNNRMESWALKNSGDQINTSTFSGITSGFYFATGVTGTQFVAFKAKSDIYAGGGIGWFAFYMGDAARGDVVYTGGSQFADDGETLTVGSGYSTPGDSSGDTGTTGAVPEPGSATIGLTLLALGAVGLRRRRAKSNDCEDVTAT
jgi:hypothetical protein